MTSLVNAPSWQQGQVIDLTIDDLSNSGDGVGRWQERVVFVPNTVPGDTLQVRLTRIKPTYGYGKWLTMIVTSVLATGFVWYLVQEVLGIFLRPFPFFMGN